MSTLKAFNTPKGPPALGPFSHAKMNDSLLFSTGQLGIDPATGNIVPGGVGQLSALPDHDRSHIIAHRVQITGPLNLDKTFLAAYNISAQ
jgi:hypothetical protein